MNHSDLTEALAEANRKMIESMSRLSKATASLGHHPIIADPEEAKQTILGKDEDSQRIFWKYLVQVGWKQTIVHSDKYAGSVAIVLPHEKCGRIMDTRMLHSIETEQAKYLGSTRYRTIMISRHRSSTRGCKAIPEEGEE